MVKEKCKLCGGTGYCIDMACQKCKGLGWLITVKL